MPRAAAVGSVGAAALALVGAAAWSQSPALARVLARQDRVVGQVPTAAPLVALTFDDGPDPTLTPLVLEALGRHGARATFFVLGSRVEAHPEVVRSMTAAGHEVADHGWADEPAVLLSAERYRADLLRTSAAIRAAAGTSPTLTRPGSGWVRPDELRTADGLGLRTVLGSIAVRHDEVADVEAAVRFVLPRVRPGSVVVLHEGLASRGRVVDLLDRLVPAITARGYRCVTVGELLASAGSSPTGQRSIS